MKRTIAVICGGDSSEHDVSLRSGAGVYSFFNKDNYDVFLVDIKGLDWHVNLPDGSTSPIDRNDFSFLLDGKKKTFDYAYITIHGTPGENGLLQGYFDLLHLPYSTSGVLVESMTFDKFVLNNYLRQFGVSVAESILVRHGEENNITEEDILSTVGFPCFVKPAADGSSFGVSKVKAFPQLASALDKAFCEHGCAMIESYLEGTEISQGVYKTREKSVVLPATEVVTSNEFFDYDTTDRCRRLPRRASRQRRRSVWQSSPPLSTTSSTPTASYASTTSSVRTPTAPTRLICWKSTLLRA